MMATFLKVTEGGLSEIALHSMINRVYFILTRQPLLYWRSEVSDELFGVVVNGSSFSHSRNNGGKVVISQDHF